MTIIEKKLTTIFSTKSGKKPVRITNEAHPFKYYDVIAIASVAMWLVASILAQKIITLGGGYVISVSALFFPLSYILSDIMTEVYGFARTRRIAWIMTACMGVCFVLFSFSMSTSTSLSALLLADQSSFAGSLGYSGRVIFASLLALFISEIVHGFFLAKMKVWLSGEKLWMRTVSSTFIAQGLGLSVFYTVAFVGVLPFDSMTVAIFSLWFLKTIYEAVMTPVTYYVINRLKRAEGVDFFDTKTDFTPFAFALKSPVKTLPFKDAANDASLQNYAEKEKKHA